MADSRLHLALSESGKSRLVVILRNHKENDGSTGKRCIQVKNSSAT